MKGHFVTQLPIYEFENIPVCSDYCDAWFDACKDDLTCVEDWIADFDFTENVNKCPAEHTCRNFTEVYGNGEGLCNRMWGATFFYSTDKNNCTVMTFNSSMPNPNFQLTFPKSGGVRSSNSMVNSALVYGSMLLMFLTAYH